MQMLVANSISRPTQGLVAFVFRQPPSQTVNGKIKKSRSKGSNDPHAELLKTKLFVSGIPAEFKNIIEKEEIFRASSEDVICLRNVRIRKIEHLIVVRVGGDKKGHFDIEDLRRAAGQVFHCAKAHKLKTLTVAIDSLREILEKYSKSAESRGDSVEPPMDLSLTAQGITEGMLLAEYSPDLFKGQINGQKNYNKIEKIIFSTSQGEAKVRLGIKKGTILSDATNFARRLGDTPGNLMTPRVLALESQKMARGTGLRVIVWNRAKIVKEKMGGLLGVSLGSSQEPRFIILEYRGGRANQRPLCLVGKGLTFDSGGISIKPSQNMEEMKYDMCGGGAVIGAMKAIAQLKLKINVIGLVPSTENMPGPSANKPGDILTARNGVTIEVNNTDAEGRLILADALSYASEKKPQCILDAATLTGAIVVALGSSYTGLFTESEKLLERLKKATGETGEPVWHMPMCEDYSKDIQGTFADISNISSTKGAGSSTAAAFLKRFIADEIPWAHLDIAGTAWSCPRLSYMSKKGATGVMVRTFVRFAEDLAAQPL